MVNSKKFDEVFVGDKCIKLPTPFKREREWLTEFVILNQNKHKTFDEDYREFRKKIAEDDTGTYLIIRNIGFLFNGMGDFNCNKSLKLFDLWDEKKLDITKRIEVIDRCLDVYDIFFPYSIRKPILSQYDLRLVHNLMDRFFMILPIQLWMKPE